jgi:chemotaxis signal transduction protein
MKAKKQASAKLTNEDVFYLVRFALTGNSLGAPMGEVAEVIGMKECVKRLNNL